MGVDAVLLVDGHFEFFQIEIGDALLEDTNEEILRELILIREAGGGYGLKTVEESAVGLVALSDGGEGIVGELVIVTVVSEGGGALREVAQVGFVLFIEKGVLGGETIGERFEVLGESWAGQDQQEEQYFVNLHG
jgi:hypothetical protein